jgi:hypothetical protein
LSALATTKTIKKKDKNKQSSKDKMKSLRSVLQEQFQRASRVI